VVFSGNQWPVWGPLVTFAVLGLLTLLLRWTFSHGRSLVARRPRSGSPDDYGLLVSVAEPASTAEGERLVSRLRDAGLQATLAPTDAGPRVMVFAQDRERALQVLSS
jgi:hypothetical protein